MIRPADAVWVGLPLIAVAHNTWAAMRGREQLSEAMDRYRVSAPLTEVAVWLTAAHLSRRLPHWADPWAWLHTATMNACHHGWVKGVGATALGVLVLTYAHLPHQDTMVDLGD